jgi:stage II sporulation protein D
MVTIHRTNGTIEQISLNDYIIGVVSAEMPASFQTEALKAQSVVARTYTLKLISQNRSLTDTESTQSYKDINQLKAYWGNSFDTYYNKIKNVVSSTKGEYLTYNGQYIDAVYHSTSNGKTEDATAVWGNNIPYLKSVDSHWDLNAPSYSKDMTEGLSIVDNLLGISVNDQSHIEILSRTPGNRIDQIKIDDTVYTGKHLREVLGLRSTDFDIKIENGNITFTTRGYGHGVGMSLDRCVRGI